MASLTQDTKGNYRARKRLPDDVREDYGRLYGARFEAKFFAPKTLTKQDATKRYGEWLAEVEGRVAAIRAERDGTGRSLTPTETRKLAGEWYEWYVARLANAPREELERRRDAVADVFYEALGEGGVSEQAFEQLGNDELWRAHPALQEAVRPVIADIGETAQFLAAKQTTLANETRNRFLDFLYGDLGEALQRLNRHEDGDYSPDTYSERFPKTVHGANSGVTPLELFKNWVEVRKPARGTIESWQYVFQGMQEHFEDRSAGSITPEEARTWIKSLITKERSAHTVRRTWLNASKTVFGWAIDEKLIAQNVFTDIKVAVSRKLKLRATKAFTVDEQQMILRASLALKDTGTPTSAAQRWVPWLCAYTGARSGEITQLRGQDVIVREGVHALRITPEAGTVKGGSTREVPIHDHLISHALNAHTRLLPLSCARWSNSDASVGLKPRIENLCTMC